ncbi:hypothetical protein [Terrarubrum flagellatum]|uniref:hypothetical protein n=1 Tax=Terrirubrum flagellatum TaxID=2895980 RepID=UPI003145585C
MFATFNIVRILAYAPQMRKAATDPHGAEAISCVTWSVFAFSHLTTAVYAIVNQHDIGVAALFVANAACCLLILGAAVLCKRRSNRSTRGNPVPS